MSEKEYKMNMEGYLVDRDDWDENFMQESIFNDGLGDRTGEIEKYCLKAREMYENDGVVPTIRVFAKANGMDRKAKDLYELFTTAPMKKIARYAGLPQATGCT